MPGFLALLATPEFWLRLLEISVLNLFLSGDNAVVIALAVRVLPKRQRLQGQIWGTVGALEGEGRNLPLQRSKGRTP